MNKLLNFILQTVIGFAVFILLDYFILHSINWIQAIVMPIVLSIIYLLFDIIKDKRSAKKITLEENSQSNK